MSFADLTGGDNFAKNKLSPRFMSRRIAADNINGKINLDVSDAQRKIHDLTESSKRLREQNKALNRSISELARKEGDNSAEVKRLDEAIKNNNATIRENKKQIQSLESGLDLSGMSAAQLGRHLKELRRDLNNTSRAADPKEYSRLQGEIKKVERAQAEASRSSRGLLTSLLQLDKIGTAIKGVFMGIGMVIMTQVIGSFRKLTSIIMDFERANSKLAGILGTNIAGISKLTDQAKFLGRTTSATASEVTGLQTELAKLGFVQSDIENMTPAVLKFSKAVDTDLSSAAAFAGATLRIFGKNSTETENALATLAISTNRTALDFSKLQSSMATVGPVAHAAGFSLEETTALLGTLSNNGFDASSAATALRNIFLKIADSGSELSRALGEPVKNIDDLRAGLLRLESQGVDLQKALEMTDKRSVSAFMAIMKGAGNLDSLRDSITDVTDDFRQLSATMTDNASGAWKGFESAVEGLMLKFFDFRDILKEVFQGATGVVQWLGDVVDAFRPLGSMIGGVAKAFGAVIKYIGQFIGWMSKLFTSANVGRAILNGLVAAIVSYRVAVALSAKVNTQLIKSIVAKIAGLRAETTATSMATKAVTALSNAWKAHKVGIIVAGIVAVTTAIAAYCKQTNSATKVEKAWQDAEKRSSDLYVDQSSKIEMLVRQAKNENLAMSQRLAAVNQLNKIIPGYNARIDATTGKYKASTDALNKYLDALKKKLRYEANKDELAKLIKEEERLKRQKEDAVEAAEKEKKENVYKQANQGSRPYTSSGSGGAAGYSVGYVAASHAAQDHAAAVAKQLTEASDAVEKFDKKIQEGIKSGELAAEAVEETVDTSVTIPMNKATGAATAVVDKVKELRAELKALRKEDPQTDEDLKRIEDRKNAIQKQIRELTGKGKSKAKHTPGTYSEDSLDEATASADDLHQQKLLDINKLKGTIPEYDLVIKKNQEMIRYCGDLQKAMTALRDKTDATHTQTLDKIKERENEIAADIQASQQAINKATADKEAEAHRQRLEANKAFYETQEQEMRRSVNEGKVTEEAADMYLLARKKEFHEQQLQELNDFYNKLKDADYLAADERAKLLEKTKGDIRAMTSQVLTDTGTLMEKIRELSTDTTSTDGIRSMYDAQRASIEQTYDAAIQIVGQGTDKAVALEQNKQRRIAELDYQQQEQQWQLQELTGLTWGQEYERELAQLENYHKQGLIKEKDYQSKKLQLGVTNAKKYFDYYSGLSGSMFQAIQDAEIAMSDAKFDVLIQQAKNNGEDTAELEQQKENEKLEIQKKYADVNFAIKISQIIADTAVAIMQAFSQLGPIGGGIAAALITATGVAQVIQAKAERDKVKNMQPGNTSGSGSVKAAPKAERTLTGYSEGGYTGDGDRYEVAGVVHRGEYVVPKPIMENPRVIDAVGTIEAIRRNKMAGYGIPATTPAGSYADGGFTTPAAMPEFTELVTATQELREAARNIRAYVVLRDIDNARESLDRARAPFTRKP